MTMYAVSYINWYDYDLRTKFIEADSWREAIFKSDLVPYESLDEMPFDIEIVKQDYFNSDSMIEVVEVP